MEDTIAFIIAVGACILMFILGCNVGYDIAYNTALEGKPHTDAPDTCNEGEFWAYKTWLWQCDNTGEWQRVNEVPVQ